MTKHTPNTPPIRGGSYVQHPDGRLECVTEPTAPALGKTAAAAAAAGGETAETAPTPVTQKRASRTTDPE